MTYGINTKTGKYFTTKEIQKENIKTEAIKKIEFDKTNKEVVKAKWSPISGLYTEYTYIEIDPILKLEEETRAKEKQIKIAKEEKEFYDSMDVIINGAIKIPILGWMIKKIRQNETKRLRLLE